MLSYPAAQLAVYDYLLARHAADPTFTFSVRQKGLSTGGLFPGTEASGYFYFSLWAIGIYGPPVDAVAYLFERDAAGTWAVTLQAHAEVPTTPRLLAAAEAHRHQAAGNVHLVEALADHPTLRHLWQTRSLLGATPRLRYTAAEHLTTAAALTAALDQLLADTVPAIEEVIAQLRAHQGPGWRAGRLTPAEFAPMHTRLRARHPQFAHPAPAALWCVQLDADARPWATFRQQEVVAPPFDTLALDVVATADPDAPTPTGNGRQHLAAVRPGHAVVVVSGPRRVLGVGLATGRFVHDPARQPPDVCPVEWLLTTPVELTSVSFNTGTPLSRSQQWERLRDAYALADPAGLAAFEDRLRGLPAPAAAPRPEEGERPPAFWAIGAGEGGSEWPQWLADGLMTIGWDDVGDLRQYPDREAVRQALLRVYPGDSNKGNDSLACWEFSREVQPGDFVIAKIGRRTILGIGRVTGSYTYRPDRAEFHHVHPVDWLLAGPWQRTDTAGVPTKTLTEVTRYAGFLDPLLEEISQPTHLTGVNGFTGFDPDDPDNDLGEVGGEEEEEETGLVAPPLPPYTEADAHTDLFLPLPQLRELLASLRRKHNLILQGPPGVGKSFVAQRLAYLLLGHADPQRVRWVQFHPSYSYEDFLLGYRPVLAGFALKDGAFLEFVRLAQRDSQRPYVFIIDEINRANLGKVLGEAMLLLEADKRGPRHAVRLPYGQEELWLPANLYLIGTMNTADRSLAFVDFALRRRFAFRQLLPELGERFQQHMQARGVASAFLTSFVDRLRRLNEQITADPSLGEGFLVGHSYFTAGPAPDESAEQWWSRLLTDELGPQLAEYWIEEPATARQALAQLAGPSTPALLASAPPVAP